MPNLTSVTVTSGVPTAGSGTVSTLDGIIDATNGPVAVKAASTPPVATDKALVVTLRDANGNGQATMTNSAPVVLASNQTSIPVAASIVASTTDVAVTPTVTASAYTANNCIGGIMTFASILAATSFNGVLQSITAKYKGTIVLGNLNIFIFKASPSNGTYTDKTAVTWNAADMANLLGSYVLSTPLSLLGTMTTYNLDNIGKALVGASQSLFVVATVSGTPTPASTSDFTLELSVLPG